MAAHVLEGVVGAIQTWYDHYVMPRFVTAACGARHVFEQRAQVVPAATGIVLEVGIGPGHNLPLYDPAKVKRVIGVDPVVEMTARSAKALATATVAVEMLKAGAEDLPLESNEIDCAVLTFTACTIPPIDAALAEIHRVLKPGGELLFLEHGLSPDPRVARWQHRLDRGWGRLAGGCHVNRDVAALLESGGFEIRTIDSGYAPKTPRFLGYVSRGVATPR